jgi:hypothetical protein
MPSITMNTQRRMSSSLSKRRDVGKIMHISGDDSCSSIRSYQSARSTESSGWGSVRSRKSYACLSSLVDVEICEERMVQSSPIPGDTWGYFVDTTI